MKPIHRTLALLVLSTGTSHASTELTVAEQPKFGKLPTLFEKASHVRPLIYGANVAENPNDQLFKGTFKTDPRLLLGIEISPRWSVEAGYANLFDRGFHRIDERDARDTEGALGINGFSSHAAVKYTLPVTDRLSAYGKLGIAYSETAGSKDKAGETGLYTGVGARLKVNDRMTIGGEYGNHGGSVKSWGSGNSSGLKADVGISF